MRKVLVTISIAFLSIIATAQTGTTVNVTAAGTLSSLLNKTQSDTISILKLTGKIDTRDVKFLRDSMPVLAILDMESVQVMAYNGFSGTTRDGYAFPANQMPNCSFSAYSSSVGKVSLKSIKLPLGLTSIGQYAFYQCRNLSGSLLLPNTIRSIGTGAFNGCYGLKGNLILPDSITIIDDIAFGGCKGLTGNLRFPKAVTHIGWNSFSDCSNFSDSIHIPTSVVTIGEDAFSGTAKIKVIQVEADNKNYASVEGVLYNKNSTKLIQFPGSKISSDYIIPTTVDTIWESAFANCSMLTGSLILTNNIRYIGSSAFINCNGLTGDLILPNSVSSIEGSTFQGCSGFTGKLIIPNSVKSIGYTAFYECYGFTGNLTIPNSVTSIGMDAFYGCWGLTGNVTLPNSVLKIGGYAFGSCHGFKGDLTIPSSLISIDDNAFFNCDGLSRIIVSQVVPPTIFQSTFKNVNTSTCQLVVPVGSKSAYKAASYWKDFIIISEDFLLVAFNTGGGSAVSDLMLPTAATIAIPTDPGKTGYTFAGWFKEVECTSAWSFSNDVVSVNTTLYAKWTLNNYTLVFESNGGTLVSGLQADYNSKITAPAPPTKTGCIFKGWYKDEVFTKVWNFTTDVVTGTATLYAKWTPVIYTVSFESNGGTVLVETNADYYTIISDPAEPTKTGYTFAGWYKDAGYTNGWNFATDSVKTNSTLYAKWAINSYTVYFIQGGNITTGKANYNTTIEAPVNPVITGYTFAGWFKDANHTNAWNFTTDRVTSDTALFPKWMAKVSFNVDGGSYLKDTLVDIATKLFMPGIPSKSGYTFEAWYKDSNFTSSWDFTTDPVNENTTLYAKWTNMTDVFNNLSSRGNTFYPNPVKDYLFFEAEDIEQVELFTLAGVAAMQFTIQNKGAKAMDLRALKPGEYVVRIKTKNIAIKAFKLVKK